MELELLKFETTPGEKHLGIATVRYRKCIILRYKVQPKRDGSPGYYCNPASYRMERSGLEHYEDVFALESSWEGAEITRAIESWVYSLMKKIDQQKASGEEMEASRDQESQSMVDRVFGVL